MGDCVREIRLVARNNVLFQRVSTGIFRRQENDSVHSRLSITREHLREKPELRTFSRMHKNQTGLWTSCQKSKTVFGIKDIVFVSERPEFATLVLRNDTPRLDLPVFSISTAKAVWPSLHTSQSQISCLILSRRNRLFVWKKRALVSLLKGLENYWQLSLPMVYRDTYRKRHTVVKWGGMCRGRHGDGIPHIDDTRSNGPERLSQLSKSRTSTKNSCFTAAMNHWVFRDRSRSFVRDRHPAVHLLFSPHTLW
jgi:hypothetical protein